ncbi:hypothetical protein BpHYR1_038262 [Brachionus plicatilis]|uniref:Uncharacterized protein n=1 Tax=Brachionus plicatilis TaxID=10195 RepID=A0A3M7RFY7_BRAPC|nr:hypothetical protein BpHYR1_038262 [Brachionus plicatilis]
MSSVDVFEAEPKVGFQISEATGILVPAFVETLLKTILTLLNHYPFALTNKKLKNSTLIGKTLGKIFKYEHQNLKYFKL